MPPARGEQLRDDVVQPLLGLFAGLLRPLINLEGRREHGVEDEEDEGRRERDQELQIGSDQRLQREDGHQQHDGEAGRAEHAAPLLGRDPLRIEERVAVEPRPRVGLEAITKRRVLGAEARARLHDALPDAQEHRHLHRGENDAAPQRHARPRQPTDDEQHLQHPQAHRRSLAFSGDSASVARPSSAARVTATVASSRRTARPFPSGSETPSRPAHASTAPGRPAWR